MSRRPAQMNGHLAYGCGMENVHLLGTDLGSWEGRQLSIYEKGGGTWMSGEQSVCVMCIACSSDTFATSESPPHGVRAAVLGYRGEGS